MCVTHNFQREHVHMRRLYFRSPSETSPLILPPL